MLLVRVVCREALRIAVLTYAAAVGLIVAALATQLLALGAPLAGVADFSVQMLLFATPLALPLAVGAGVMCTVGRMREDGELTALRAAGISPLRVISGLLPLALIAALVLGWLMHDRLPAATRALREGRASLLQQALATQVAQQAPLAVFDGTVVQAGDYADGHLGDVFVYSRDGDTVLAMHARHAAVGIDDEEGALHLRLDHAELLHHTTRSTGQADTVAATISQQPLVLVPQRERRQPTADTLSTTDLVAMHAAKKAEIAAMQAAGKGKQIQGLHYHLQQLSLNWHLRWALPALVLALWLCGSALGLTSAGANRLLALLLNVGISLVCVLPAYVLVKGPRGAVAIPPGLLLWVPIIAVCGISAAVLWRRR